MIHERSCCNRRSLTQADGRDWREKRDRPTRISNLTLFPVSPVPPFPLVSHRSRHASLAPRACRARLHHFSTNRHGTIWASKLSNPLSAPGLVSLIDKSSSRGENDRMPSLTTTKALCVIVFMGGVACMFGGITAATASAASPLYWCPDQKADRQYSARQGPGCVPLVEKKETLATEQEGEAPASDKPPRDFKIENLQGDVSAFLREYRHFLDCCKTDPDELQRVENLGEEVSELLELAQSQLSNYSMASRGIMLREMIPPVAKARADLQTLRARLEKIGETSKQRDQAEFEEAGRETRAILEVEESIDKDIRAPKLPASAKTGVGIGVAPAAGPSIGKTPKTGTAIGVEGRTGQDVGMSPRNSSDIGGSGPTGFAIGATGRPGPSIGDSTLNSDTSSAVNSSLQRSTVGSSISDSSVGSSMGHSSVGSNLQDSSVGSSFGGSSVGSSMQNHLTDPRK